MALFLIYATSYLGCTQEVYSWSSITDLESYFPYEMEEFTGTCTTFWDNTPWSNRPEDSLGQIFERPLDCNENLQGEECIWSQNATGLSNITTESIDLDGTPLFQIFVTVEDFTSSSLNQALGTSWLGAQFSNTSVLLITYTETYDGYILHDTHLDSAQEEFWETVDSNEKAYSFVEFSKLDKLKIQEYYYIGDKAPNTSSTSLKIINIDDSYYQDSGTFFEENILQICVQLFSDIYIRSAKEWYEQ